MLHSQPTNRWALFGVGLIIATLLVLTHRQGTEYAGVPRVRRLIVSTDDAGMCPSVNEATITALRHGSVTSVSIMTCCPAFEEFVTFAAANPQYDYGIHLTLTCDVPVQPWGPVLPVAKVPSLADDLGYFWPETGDVAERARIDEVERELRAQIQRALRAGIRLTHIDHHMYVLYDRPDLLELYARLAVEFHVPARLCREPGPPSLRRNEPEWLAAHRRSVQRLEEAGLPLLDAIESDNYAQRPAAKREYHLQTVRDLPFGVTEIVIHCSSLAGRGVPPPDVERRVADMRFFLSAEARQEITRLGIQCVGWGDLQRVGGSPTK